MQMMDGVVYTLYRPGVVVVVGMVVEWWWGDLFSSHLQGQIVRLEQTANEGISQVPSQHGHVWSATWADNLPLRPRHAPCLSTTVA